VQDARARNPAFGCSSAIPGEDIPNPITATKIEAYRIVRSSGRSWTNAHRKIWFPGLLHPDATELLFHGSVYKAYWSLPMQAAIDRILSTYRLLHNLSEDEIEALRTDVTTFLAEQEGLDEKRMAVEGLRYLRRSRIA
jgi:hypothetical protein